LKPCKEVAEEIRSYHIILHNYPGTFPEWEATGRPTLYDLEQKIIEEHPDWDTKPTKEQIKTNQCFIATATMGDANHPSVLLLREFRDTYLLRKSAGRLFVNWYYEIGPHAARVIARSRILRRISYWLVVRPAAKVAIRSMSKARRERGEV
jgi:hypothetical protein